MGFSNSPPLVHWATDLPGPQCPLFTVTRRRQAWQEPVCCWQGVVLCLFLCLTWKLWRNPRASGRVPARVLPVTPPGSGWPPAPAAPKSPGRGALCFVPGAGKPETGPFCYCESSPGHYTLLSHNNAALSRRRGGPTRLPWRRRRYPGARPTCLGGDTPRLACGRSAREEPQKAFPRPSSLRDPEGTRGGPAAPRRPVREGTPPPSSVVKAIADAHARDGSPAPANRSRGG